MTSVQTDDLVGRATGIEPTLKLLDAPVSTVEDADNGDSRTIHAVRLFDFASVFAARFLHRTYGAPRLRRIRLNDDDSPSTAGGRLARRSILLVPDDGQRDTLVIGWVDVARKRSEVRTFESLERYFFERFGADIDLAREDYEKVTADMTQLLEAEGIHQSWLAAAPRPAAPPVPVRPAPSGAPACVAFWAVGVLTGFCLAYAFLGA